MVDITKMVAPKTDQLNADDLLGGKTRDIKITKVKENDSKEQPLSIYFEGDNNKPWKPCLGMRRVLIDLWGDDVCREASKNFVGRMVRLYRDPDVKFGGTVMGGIRISHASNIERETKILVTTARARRVEFLVKPLKIQETKAAEPAPEPAEEKPAHVKTALAVVKKIMAAQDENALYEVMTTECADDIVIVEIASAETHAWLMDKHAEKLKEFQNEKI